MAKLRDYSKQLLKSLIPPIIYNGGKKIVYHQSFTPQWNTLAYPPLKGVQIFFDPKGAWQKKMMNGTYDTFLFEAIQTLQPTGKIILDIGAHIGYHSFYFSRLIGPKGNVFTFEPNKKNVERIQIILDKNPDMAKNVSVFDCAVSDTVGTATFNTNEDIESGRSTGNFLGSADTFWDKEVYTKKGFVETKVKTVTIDSFGKEFGITSTPDIIKIDVEGAEYSVLQGAKQTLLTKKPILFIEVHSIKCMFDVATFLTSIAYDIKLINTESNGVCYVQATPQK